MNADKKSGHVLGSWHVRSIWASTDIRFQQWSWPFAVFTMDTEGLTLRARWTWTSKWNRSYEEIAYVLINGKSFFIVATDLTYGRVIGNWKLTRFVEQELLARNVRIQSTDESLNLLLFRRKRERLSHYPFEA